MPKSERCYGPLMQTLPAILGSRSFVDKAPKDHMDRRISHVGLSAIAVTGPLHAPKVGSFCLGSFGICFFGGVLGGGDTGIIPSRQSNESPKAAHSFILWLSGLRLRPRTPAP